MLRRAWKPALVVSAPVLGYLYYTREQTFDLPVRVRGPDGKATMSTRTLPLLSMAAVDARIREKATANTVSRPGIVWHHTTASVNANDPIEDATANQVIRRDEGDGDLLFFTVMDGHGGYYTSQLLSRVLINAVALELSALDKSASDGRSGWLNGIKSALWGPPTVPANKADVDIHVSSDTDSPATPRKPDADPVRVARAIQTAFTSLDAELIAAPLRVLAAALEKDKDSKSTEIPDLSKHPLALPAMLPAMSGSCALLALFDTAHRNLYVACTGDSRAVAGIWEPDDAADAKGRWRAEVLSEDQTGRNPSELARIQSEHPASEAGDVIRNGRILGGLEPSRAFGDARYKWSRGLQETLARAFLSGTDISMRSPSLLRTPPYVTARPVVTHRVLNLPVNDTAAPKDKPVLRFIVLATDGLWDELSSEDVVQLVGGHLGGLSGVVPKNQLSQLVPITVGAEAVEGKAARRKRESDGKWAFVDENPSAHLIRNAFGGGDTTALRRLLSIPAPLARRHRDDVSVTVVWWEEAKGTPEIASLTIGKDEVKAKL
ncbi:PPM-type phosphatase domain-containing protein [Mycena sanguinolenta]|uniref:PPM-type phosphatase domain-containing protein n=1 Tax=Mycena sanguinolenta TaxID=230812 RepID=A0A8H6YB72_9AGAR|nr:PPM-type phosphatase domain-containing protein [Mycena sanguinolenta]